MTELRLYGYWRSSSTWRVRIVLAHKGLAYDSVPVHLVRDGGEQYRPDYVALNPMAQVPTLEVVEGKEPVAFGQSVAIVEYLEERFPQAPLLPTSPLSRARVRELVEIVNSGTQPLQNLRVLKAMEAAGVDRQAWGRDAIRRGLEAFAHQIKQSAGPYACGEQLTLADVFLIPQLYNARRFETPFEGLESLLAIEAHCEALPAFQAAHPDRQADAIKS